MSYSNLPTMSKTPITSKLAVITEHMNKYVREENAALSNLVCRRNRYIAHLQEELHRSLELNEALQRSLNQFQHALMTLQRQTNYTSPRFQVELSHLHVPQLVENVDASTEEEEDTQETTLAWEDSPDNPENYPEHPNYQTRVLARK